MESESKFYGLQYPILKHLLSGGAIYLYSMDPLIREEAFSYLKKSHFSELVLNPKESSKKEIIRAFDEDCSYEDFPIIQRYSDYFKRLSLLIYQYHRPVFGDLRWEQVTEKAVKAQFSYSKEFLTSQLRSYDFTFDRKEYWKIRGRVDSFSKLFSSSFIIIESNDLFHDSVYRYPSFQDANSIISEQLEVFSTRVYDLINHYINYFGRLRNRYQLEFHENIGILKKKILDFDFLLEAQLNEESRNEAKSFFSFSRKKGATNLEEIRQEWSLLQVGLQEFDIQLESFNITEPDDYKSLAVQALDELSKLHTKEEVFYTEYLKRLNTNAQIDNTLHSLENKLDRLIEELNQSTIFNEKIQNHSISSLKKFELLKDLQALLFKGQDQLSRFEGYYQWKSSKILLDSKIQNILDVLVYVKPENWIDAFDAWYLSKVAEMSMPNDFPSLKITRTAWELIQDQLNFDPIEAFVASKIVERVKLLNQHKMTYSDSYKSLIEESDSSVTNDLIKKLENCFFPIQIVQEWKDEPNAYCIDLDKLNLLDTNQNPIIKSSILKEKASIFLVNKDNRLKSAESLASIFLLNNPTIVLYVSKHAKYIVQLSDWKLDYFISTINSSSLKRIHLNDLPKERMTEFFLIHEIPTYYVYEDFISGTHYFDALINQKMMSDICDEANIRLISIDSYRLLFGEEKIQSQLKALDGDN